MPKRKLYDVMGVSRDASDQEIRKAYRDLARKYHPDRNQGDKEAEERFKELTRASEVLLNKKKKGLYDEFGEMGLREGFDPHAYREWSKRRGERAPGGGGAGFGGLEDLFEQVRRGRAGAQGGGGAGFSDFFSGDMFDGTVTGKRRRKPAGASAEITIEWMEAVLGVEKELLLQMANEEGTQRELRVRIPAGVRDGGQVRLREQAADGGDIVLRVHVKEHPVFRREGDDLELTLPVTVGEAFHGAKIQVPTPYGAVTLRVPAGVRGGSKLRLKGKGVRRGEQAGDLFAVVNVVLPVGEQAQAAVDALEKTYAGPVRTELDAQG
jgi:DnaJ-class molecular chaperone